MTLASGTCFGPYKILAPLGAGRMGGVYRVHDPSSGATSLQTASARKWPVPPIAPTGPTALACCP